MSITSISGRVSNTDTSKFWTSMKATFVLKIGPNTSNDAVLKMWTADSSSYSQSVRFSSSLSPGNATGGQSFTAYDFMLYTGAGATLDSFFNLTLQSDADDNASRQWFIKGDFTSTTFDFLDAEGNSISSITYLGSGSGTGGGSDSFQASSSSAPEPASAIVFGLLVATLAGVKRFRQHQSPV